MPEIKFSGNLRIERPRDIFGSHAVLALKTHIRALDLKIPEGNRHREHHRTYDLTVSRILPGRADRHLVHECGGIRK